MTGAKASPGENGAVVTSKQYKRKLILGAVLLLFLAVVILLLWRYYHPANLIPPPPASASTVEKQTQTSVDSFLKGGNSEAYQVSQCNLAIQYLESNDINNASRIMSEVFQKVSQDKLLENSFYTMVQVQQKKGDNQEYKKYLQLLINKLKADGKTDAANQEQKILDGLK